MSLRVQIKRNTYLRNEEIADIERLRSTISKKIITLSIEQRHMNIRDKKSIEFYNNSFHSTIKKKPINVENGKCDKLKIYNITKQNKKNYIEKTNESRECSEDHRYKVYIKNYKSLRYKKEPKFRESGLQNIHSSNIKRPTKYDGLVNIKQLFDKKQ